MKYVLMTEKHCGQKIKNSCQLTEHQELSVFGDFTDCKLFFICRWIELCLCVSR